METISSVEFYAVLPDAGRTASGVKTPETKTSAPEESKKIAVPEEKNEEPKANVSISTEEVERIARSIDNAISKASGTRLKFNATMDEASSTPRFQVVDKETGKVVREFPVEELMELAEKESVKSGQGLLVDAPV